MTDRYDLVISGGTVVDGSGAEPFVADVGVRDGMIRYVGQIAPGSATTEIDAGGRIVTPGFVDIHTHYDGHVTWETSLRPSSDHGVTTVVMGNCGVGFAPCRAGDQTKLVKLMEGVEDIPEVVMTEGIPWAWESFPDYLDFVASREFDVDCAAYIPHAALRVYVMGERAVVGEDATDADLERMTELVTEGVRAGAIGVATSRTLFHRDSAGDPAGHVRASRRELLALARGVRLAGGGVFEVAPQISDVALESGGAEPGPEVIDRVIDEELDLLRAIAAESGGPVSYALLDMKNAPTLHTRALEKTAELVRAGVDVKAQVMCRPIGLLFGLDLTLHPFRFHPSYQDIAELPLAERVAALRSDELRGRLLDEQPDARYGSPVKVMLAQRALNSYRLGDPADYRLTDEASLVAEAARQGVSEWALALDWLLENDGTNVLMAPIGNFSKPNLATVSELISHPDTLIGLGDGGAHLGLLCDASFPTTLLAYWARDREKADRLSLPAAVNFLTRRNAEAVGLTDRGLVAPGMKGDLNVIDFDELTLCPPEVRYDLPAGGRRVIQRARGYDATVVNGVVTWRAGQQTGATPGRLVRAGRNIQ